MRDVNNKMSDAVAGVTASQDDYDYSISLKNFILTQLKPSTIALGDEIDLSSILGEDWFDCNGEAADTNENVAASPETTNANPPTAQRKWGRKRMLDTTCSICQKQFRNGSLLNRHLQKHYPQHKCPKCAKVFSRKETKLKHIDKCMESTLHRKKKSTPESEKIGLPRFFCDECGKSFTRKENYAQHLMVHTRLHVVCDTCNITLSSFKSYKRHVKLHDTSKDASKLSCDQCPAQFALKWNLRRHVEWHQTQDERPVCSKCGSILKNKQVLSEHNENEPLNCTLCSKIFCLDNDFKNHLKSAHRDVWFRCKECSSSLRPFMTRTEYLLKKHVKNHHNVILNSRDCYKNTWYVSLDD